MTRYAQLVAVLVVSSLAACANAPTVAPSPRAPDRSNALRADENEPPGWAWQVIPPSKELAARCGEGLPPDGKVWPSPLRAIEVHRAAGGGTDVITDHGRLSARHPRVCDAVHLNGIASEGTVVEVDKWTVRAWFPVPLDDFRADGPDGYYFRKTRAAR